MKKLILNIIFFLSIIFTINSFLVVYFYVKTKNETVKLFKKNIIIGDSNTRWSLDDHILKNYSNYSVGGETYLFAYTKLKIFDRNNKIDTLLLAFSPHNIINNPWWDDSKDQPIQGRMPAFFSDFTEEEHFILMKYLPRNYLKSIIKINQSNVPNFFKLKKQDPMFRFGFYLPEKHNESKVKREYYPYKKPSLSLIEKKYLDKILAECKHKNIKLILINPPKNYLRSDYKNYDHPEFYSYYYKYYSSVDFLDFSRIDVPKNGYYDMTHVSIIGAEYFSNFLQKKGLFNLLNSKYNKKNDHR